LGPNPLVTVMSAGGHVVGRSLQAHFGSRLNVGEMTALHPFFPDSPGLTDPMMGGSMMGGLQLPHGLPVLLQHRGGGELGRFS